VVGHQGSVVKQSLVLSHSVVEGNVVVLHPAAERVEEEQRVLVSLLDELLPTLSQQQTVPVMKRVPHLEGVDGVGVPFLSDLVDLGGCKPVLVQSVIVLEFRGELHLFSGNQEIALLFYSSNSWVLKRPCSECFCANFFLSVFINFWLFNDCYEVVFPGNGYLFLSLEFFFVVSGDILDEGHTHEVLFAVGVGDGVHVHRLEQLLLRHESV